MLIFFNSCSSCVFLFLFLKAQSDFEFEVEIDGKGASFPNAVYQRWIFLYSFVTSDVVLSYTSAGSSLGKAAILNNEVDFGASDAPLTDEEFEEGGDVNTFPMVAGAVVIPFNIPTFVRTDPPPVLSREVLADIFLGNIRYWNDSAIVDLNLNNSKLVSLLTSSPSHEIRIIVRQDGSGTTDIFTKALSAMSEEWRDAVGAGEEVAWPLFYSQEDGNGGVIAKIRETEWSLGYAVQANVIDAGDVTDANLINKAGRDVSATAETVQSAMNDGLSLLDERLTADIVDPQGENSWPIAGYSYLLLRTESSTDCKVMEQLLNWIVWAQTHPGAASEASRLGYATLPPSVRKKMVDKLATIRCADGQKPLVKSVIVGSGASLPAAAYSEWAIRYQRRFPDTLVTYISEGSTKGRANFIADLTDFGASDAIMSDAEKQQTNGTIELLPLVSAAVVMAYNLPSTSAAAKRQAVDEDRVLVLSREVLADIYRGVIDEWDDNRLIELNPMLEGELRDAAAYSKIKLVTRSDGSGTTTVFTTALSSFSSEFGTEVGVDDYVDWTDIGIPADRIHEESGNDGVIARIKQTPYSMGYVVNADAIALGVPFSKLINRAGYNVTADADSIRAAADDFAEAFTDGLTVDIVDGPSEGAWPIAAYSYILVRKTIVNDETNVNAVLFDCGKIEAMLDWFAWTQTTTEGIVSAERLGFATTSVAVRRKVLTTMATFTCDGETVFSLGGCLRGGDICSDRGECLDGQCVCEEGYTGSYCQDRVKTKEDKEDDNTLTIALATILPVLAVLLVIMVMATVVLLLWRRQKRIWEAKQKEAGMMMMLMGGSQKWMIDYSELEMLEQIGIGAYGAVYKANWKGSEVAVKMLNTNEAALLATEEEKNEDGDEADPEKGETVSDTLKTAFIEEVSVMTELRHPNVVLFMAACTQPPNMCIVMEYMQLGSLYDVLHNELIPVIPFAKKVKMALQAARGLHFLHEGNIIHRDVKSLNLLLDQDWNIKVSDFGLTNVKDKLKTKGEEQLGSIFWTAPEVLEHGEYSKASDVYSFGIVLWEILSRKDPYEGMSPTAVAVGVLRDNLRPEIPEGDTPEDLVMLVQECWAADPASRPSFLEVMTRLSKYTKPSKSSMSGGSLFWSNQGSNETSNSANYNSAHNDEDKYAGLELMNTEGGAGLVPPPTGKMTIIFSDIQRAAALWEFDPYAMKEATLLHNTIIREALREFHGYEVALLQEGATGGEGSFCLAFQDAVDAVSWCAAVQERLLKADWPEKLLEHPHAAEETSGADDEVVFRGLRVRMGLHYGEPRMGKDPMTRRIEYIGPVVNKAARITTIAHGGQVVVSENFFTITKGKADVKGVATLTKLGKFDLAAGQGESEVLYELRPNALSARFFGGAEKEKEKSKRKENSNSFSDSSSVMSAHVDPLFKEDAFLTSANLCRWIINFKQLQLGPQIGVGSYGIVYKAKWKGVDVAVKKFIKQKLSEKRMLEFRAEMAFLSELHHPNIVLFIGACVRRPHLCIVTEYMKKGSLKDILRDKATQLPWNLRMKMARSIALGLHYLHSLEPIIIHRDLKSSNLLVDENWNVKIADFGFARIREENATMTRCGTPCWTAPEVIRGEEYSEKADIYSFGIILWELASRQVPYGEDMNFMGVTLKVLEGVRPKMPPKTPDSFAKLIKSCWHVDPKKRPSVKKILQFFDEELGEEIDS
ncbi:Serine/threonine protein kinase, catalytic domain containing protein, variant 2 [Balamuthia mandrillaris]